MPNYPWLAENRIATERLASRLKAMQRLGVPYDDAVVNNPKEAYLAQATKIQDGLKAEGIEVSEYSEIIALIAYMQRLGTDINKQEESK